MVQSQSKGFGTPPLFHMFCMEFAAILQKTLINTVLTRFSPTPPPWTKLSSLTFARYVKGVWLVTPSTVQGRRGETLKYIFLTWNTKCPKRFDQDCSLFMLAYGKLDRTSLLQAVLSSSNMTCGTILSGMYHCHTRLMCFLPHVADSSTKALPHRLHHMLMMLSQYVGLNLTTWTCVTLIHHFRQKAFAKKFVGSA